MIMVIFAVVLWKLMIMAIFEIILISIFRLLVVDKNIN